MLDADDLGPADESLLELLREGRVIAPYAAEETGYSLQYVRDRLGRFVEHGNVRKVYDGLYELVEDPADSDAPQRREEPARASPERREAEPAETLSEEMERVLAGLDVPGRPDAVEETRRDAIRWGWEYLREHDGPLRANELADAIFHEFEDDPDLGYSASADRYDGYQLWDNCVRTRIKKLPGVVDGANGLRFEETDAE